VLPAPQTSSTAITSGEDEVLDELSAATERLRAAFHDVPVGLTVAQAATRLDVSIPTVKKWIRERLLETVPGRSPIEVTQQSVVRVERILENVRLAYPAKQWTRALAAHLHDQDLQNPDWFVDGLAQVRRRAYVER
jgi:hypothetical protein